jgi:hypothetical protein
MEGLLLMNTWIEPSFQGFHDDFDALYLHNEQQSYFVLKDQLKHNHSVLSSYSHCHLSFSMNRRLPLKHLSSALSSFLSFSYHEAKSR